MINKKNEKGSIIYFAVLILGILFSAGVATTTILIQQIGIIGNISFSVNAFYSADAAIEKVLSKWDEVEHDDGTLFCWVNDDELCYDSYTDRLEDDQIYFLKKEINEVSGDKFLAITSVGSYKGIRRGIQITRQIHE